MWRRRQGGFGFELGFAPFGFYFHGLRPFPRRQDYLKMLQHYREELEAELSEVKKEIEELEKG